MDKGRLHAVPACSCNLSRSPVAFCAACARVHQAEGACLGAGPRAGENSLPVKQFLQNCSAVISREPKMFWEAVLATCSIKESGGRPVVVLRKPKVSSKKHLMLFRSRFSYKSAGVTTYVSY